MVREKEIDSTEVAEALVKDVKVKVLGNYCMSPMWRRPSLGLGGDELIGYSAERIKDYPPNLTDQTHALSIAEQIKVGQAQIRNDDSFDQYDFKPGQKDDGRTAVGVYDFSEPAERFEAERDVAGRIQNDLQRQIARRRATEMEKSTKKSTESEEALQKASGASSVSKTSEG